MQPHNITPSIQKLHCHYSQERVEVEAIFGDSEKPGLSFRAYVGSMDDWVMGEGATPEIAVDDCIKKAGLRDPQSKLKARLAKLKAEADEIEAEMSELMKGTNETK